VAARASTKIEVADAGLTLELPPIDDLETKPAETKTLARWMLGKLGGKQFELEVWLLPDKEYRCDEPAEVVDFMQAYFRDERKTKAFTSLERDELEGAFGARTYAEFGHASFLPDGDGAAESTLLMLGAVLPGKSCCVTITLEPKASADELTLLRGALTKGAVFAGKPPDPKWTDAEAKARWEANVPAAARKDELRPPIRTAHYIVLTNSASGALFGKKMEENYAKIRATFPFPERKGRRLLPVFLFRSNEQYQLFCKAEFKESMTGTKGHAWRDYYATSYESPNDPVHIHESTHQLFINRIHRALGGSWFQEGLAEYMCTGRGDRNAVALQVAKGRMPRLRQLMAIDDLIGGWSGGNGPAVDGYTLYTLASLWIEFVHDSKETKGKFADFVDRVGRVEAAHAAEAVQESLGIGVDELDRKFTQYCVGR
jgi:hypothetical protein